MMTSQKVDLAKLALLLGNYRKQHSITLRDAAEATGISPSTLSRIERKGVVADTDTLVKLSKWMGLELSEVFGELSPSDRVSPSRKARNRDAGVSTITNIELQLRADPNLNPESVKALTSILANAYKLYVSPKGGVARG